MIDQQQERLQASQFMTDLVAEMRRLSAMLGPPGPPGPPGPQGLPGAGFPSVFVEKTVAEQVVNSTVLQDDDQLFFLVAPGEKWVFTMYVVFEAPTTPDIKVSVAAPAGATGRWSSHPQWAPGNGFQVPDAMQFGASLPMGGSGAGSPNVALLCGMVSVGVTGGFVGLQWAQNTANVNATVVTQSWLLAFKVAP